MNFLGMGPMEVVVIMVVALIIFGPGKLPEMAAQAGKMVRDFRNATSDLTAEFQDSIDDMQATMGEMRATVTDVQRETQQLAAIVPDTLNGIDVSMKTAVGPPTPNGTVGAAVAVAAAAAAPDTATSTGAATVAAGVATPAVKSEQAPTKADPLADFGD
jgi:TatA/E family protein of Tat protein translocase